MSSQNTQPISEATFSDARSRRRASTLVALAMAGLDPASQPDTDDLREFLFEGLQDLVSRAHLELNKI